MFKCLFCDYETEKRSKIHRHHIVPKELGGSNKRFNRVDLCPNHHNKIYVPDSKQGIHSIKAEDSIILKGWYASSSGKRIMKFINTNNSKELFIEEK
jgi:hypothetical protein